MDAGKVARNSRVDEWNYVAVLWRKRKWTVAERAPTSRREESRRHIRYHVLATKLDAKMAERLLYVLARRNPLSSAPS